MYKKFFPKFGYLQSWAQKIDGKSVEIETDRIGHIGKCSIVPEWCDRTK